jgi:hypothetical protein
MRYGPLLVIGNRRVPHLKGEGGPADFRIPQVVRGDVAHAAKQRTLRERHGAKSQSEIKVVRLLLVQA